MNKWFFLCATFLVLCATACNKDKGCTSLPPATVASAAETSYLQAYLTANSIAASEKNGMFYLITAQGTGTSPNLCSGIVVDYAGNLITGTTDGAQFDASTAGNPLSITLNELIAGWQLILPLVKSGGQVTLYIPPSLGYGARASSTIPANSYLKFKITLRSVQ